jgi:hypothetical protein
MAVLRASVSQASLSSILGSSPQPWRGVGGALLTEGNQHVKLSECDG